MTALAVVLVALTVEDKRKHLKCQNRMLLMGTNSIRDKDTASMLLIDDKLDS